MHRFNPAAQRTLNLVPGDVGRSISDLKLPLEIDNLEEMIASVVNNLETRELKVRDRNARLHLLRLRPYKTTENRIEGAVMVMVDIDQVAK
ncbi:MAG: PAS domain-containing protein [Acidobacteriota bacterium]